MWGYCVADRAQKVLSRAGCMPSAIYRGKQGRGFMTPGGGGSWTMSLTLSRPEASALPAIRADFGVAGITSVSTAFGKLGATQRGQVKAALLDSRYRQILGRRLRHIPVKLPFPEKEVLGRLRENDSSTRNRKHFEAYLEAETERAILRREVSLAEQALKVPEDRKVRRLGRIWDYLRANSDFIQEVIKNLEGRLGFNTEQFLLSELPPLFLMRLGDSTLWAMAAFHIAINAEADRLSRALTSLSANETSRERFMDSALSLRAAEIAFRSYDRQMTDVCNLCDVVVDWRDALEYYVDLFSCGDLSRFRTRRPIAMTTLDPAVIEELSVGLAEATSRLRRHLHQRYPAGLAGYEWMRWDDPFLVDFLRLELESS